MNYINTVLQGNRKSSLILFLSFVISILVMSFIHSKELYAAERTSYSIDKNTNNQSKLDIKSVSDQNIIKMPALEITGAQQLLPKLDLNNRTYIGDLNLSNQFTSNVLSPSFVIFDASVELLHDNDGDGYFSSFRVIFDADVDVDFAIVYARMFISYEGGPWNYFYTTKTFEIFGYDKFDAHTVDTVFETGYPPGSYDVRIDLYEAGWTERVAVYGPYEDYDLNYLLLEDKEHESYIPAPDPHVNVITSGAGCNLNTNAIFDPAFPVMFLMSLIYFFRKKYLKDMGIKNT